MPEPKTPSRSEEATRARPGDAPSSSSPPSRAARVETTSGSVVAGRYRVIRFLGRGGMGEMYLVHDLTLDQEVALKFLPAELAKDPVRLQLFHNEVRLARHVTHKNVCRMYDIGEVEGRPFLSMEYVDGEDLASLLRRIGYLSEEKGLEVARQLAAGLAAAHEAGIVHRDLKPANVMIDGTGQVRITDFGLAGVAGQIRDRRSGTPAYQAPEQLRGEDVSFRSDLYSLGLILYEAFTGTRAFEDPTAPRELSGVKPPSSAVRQLGAQTEQAVLKCLEPRPEDRPRSALELAAMLPGADPLGEALAAGKTPSPELVAAAGQHRALDASKAFALVAAVAVGLVGFVTLRAPQLLLAELAELKPPAVLLDRAETLTKELGVGSVPHTAFGLRLENAERLRFWYRASPEPLETVGINDRVSLRDPPMTEPRMARVELDPAGKLLELVIVPSATRNGDSASEASDWKPWFDAAGLDLESYAPAEPSWIPPVFAEERLAWTASGGSPRVEAGSFAGAPVYFRVDESEIAAAPPARVDADESTLSRALSVLATAMAFAILFAVSLLARRQWKLGRGDRSGAARVATTMFVINLAGLMLGLEHFFDPSRELSRWLDALLEATFAAAVFWLFYLALEPFARRMWPHGLIAWTRLLGGRWRDPLVGRDVLIGVVAGVAMALTLPLGIELSTALGGTDDTRELPGLMGLLGPRYAAAGFLSSTTSAVNNAVLFLFLFIVVRFRLKSAWAAGGITIAVIGVMVGAQATDALDWVQGLLLVSIAVATMVRFGFLAAVVAGMTDFALRSTPFTLRWEEWYASPTLTVLGVLLAVTIYGLLGSRGGEPLFSREKPLSP